MKAKDVMTHCVVTIGAEAPIRDAIARMIGHRISGVPVVDDAGNVVGIVTEGDLVRRAETGTEAPRRRWLELLSGRAALADEYARAHGRTVQDVMSRKVVSVAPETPLAEIVRLMEEHSIKRIPVVEGKRLVGIVSRADLLLALSANLKDGAATWSADDTIRATIRADMKRQAWCPSYSVRVTVRNGVVRFSGTISDERERHALAVLAANVKGVRSVADELVLLEPLTGAVVDEPEKRASSVA
jgi:CBS domain-containing protein